MQVGAGGNPEGPPVPPDPVPDPVSDIDPPRRWSVILALALLIPAAPLALIWFPAPLGVGFAPVTPLALGVFMFSWMVALPAFVMGQIVSLILIFTRVRSLAPLVSLIFSGLFLGSAALFLMMSGRA